jgi:hypothetical protein
MKSKKIYLTREQLGRVVESIIKEGTGTDALQAIDKTKGLDKGTDKPLAPVKGPDKPTGGPS